MISRNTHKPAGLALLLLLAVTVTNLGWMTPSRPKGWTLVYAHDENGLPLAGELTKLMEGLRKGYSLKIGWGWTKKIGDSLVTLEHFAEPVFVTIVREKNVSAILPAHPLLKSYIDIGKQEFDNPDHTWQCVLTTEGSFNAMVYSQSKGILVKNWPQRHRMSWYLEYP